MEKIVNLFDTLMDGGPVPDKDTLMSYRWGAFWSMWGRHAMSGLELARCFTVADSCS